MSTARLRTLSTVVALPVGAMVLGQLVSALVGQGRMPLLLQAGQALVYGSFVALAATGLILVYRAGRIINFSQAGFGSAAVMLFMLLEGVWDWPFWLALAAALGAAAVVGVGIEVFVIRRFSRAPRLVLTVVTIALGQLLASIGLLLPRWFGFVAEGNDPVPAGLPTTPPDTPFDALEIVHRPLVLTGEAVAAILVTVLVLGALALFFRRSRVGVAIRGAAENKDRAELLGVNTNNLSSVVWALVAVLGALGTILGALVANNSVATALGSAGGAAGVGGVLGSGAFVRALVAAVVARMENLPVAVAAAFAVAVLEQSVFWALDSSALVDVAMFAVVVVALLVQRRRSSRFDENATSSWAATEEIRGVPHELAGLATVRRGIRRSLWAVAVVVLAYPWVMSPSQTDLGSLYAIYGIVGVSLVVLTGWGGQISLGQFAFVAVGAAVGGALNSRWGMPFPVAVLGGALAAAGVAVVTGLPALRIRGLYLAVTTLALAVATTAVLFNGDYFGWLLPEKVSRPAFLWINTEQDPRSYYYLCVVGLVVAVVAANRLRQSRTGRLLIAMRDNDRTAQSHGINLVRNRLSAFAASGFLAGYAGVLFAAHQHGVRVESFGPDRSILMFLMAVLGGLGSVYTVLAGAIYIGTATIVIPDLGGELLAGAAGVLAVLLFLPTGLGSVVFRLRDAWLRRVALRYRILVPSLAGDRVKRGEEALVPLAPRPDEVGSLPVVYRVKSRIGVTGASQLSKVWRY